MRNLIILVFIVLIPASSSTPLFGSPTTSTAIATDIANTQNAAAPKAVKPRSPSAAIPSKKSSKAPSKPVTPCANEASGPFSDRCIQWRSATASERAVSVAETSNTIAWTAMILSALGTFAVAIALILQWDSWRQARSSAKPRITITLGEHRKDIHGRIDFDILATNTGQNGCLVTETAYSWFTSRNGLRSPNICAVPAGATVPIRTITGMRAAEDDFHSDAVASRKLFIRVQLDSPLLREKEKSITKSFNVFSDVMYPSMTHYIDITDDA